MKTFTFLLIALFLSACASNIPQNIAHAPTFRLAPEDVIADIASSKDKPVRWGGEIMSANQHLNATDIEIQIRHLDIEGRPILKNVLQDRFLARVEGIADPASLSIPGSVITIYGMVDSIITKTVADKSYDYPVIKVQEFHVWSRPPTADKKNSENYNCGPFSMTTNSGIYPYGYSFGQGKCVNNE